jgi:aquaporin Z
LTAKTIVTTFAEVCIVNEIDSWRKYVAEIVGTFVLVFMGCGSVVLASETAVLVGGVLDRVAVAFAFGLSLLVMVYAIGNISGCHINPAVSISMLAAGKMNLKDSVLYIVMQCLGATIGAGVLLWIALGNPAYSLAFNGLGQNGYGEASLGHYSMASCFIAEVVLTFVFLLVIFGSTNEKTPKGFAGVPIGLSLVLIHLVGIPITGTSVNPARSFGPALVFALFGGQAGMVAWDQLWLFWAAPIIGAVFAAGVWRLLEKQQTT